MKPTQWIAIWLLAVTLGMGLLMLFTYAMDPLWCFGHTNQLNSLRLGFNERQQKTNYLLTDDTHYNTLILGSSRTTYLASAYFTNSVAFSYAANNMRPWEYQGYLDNFIQITGYQPQTVVLGLDFWGTNANDTSTHHPPIHYLQTSNHWAYKAQTLASFDALAYSFRNLQNNLGQPPTQDAYYDSNLTKLEYGNNQAYSAQRIRNQVKLYSELSYGNYQWDMEYQQILKSLVTSYPAIQFKVFTTPVTDTLLNILITQNRLPDYEKWLRTTVDVFGVVHHYMFPSSLSASDSLFFDTQHFQPKLAKEVANALDNEPSADAHTNHMLLTAANIDSSLIALRFKFQRLQASTLK